MSVQIAILVDDDTSSDSLKAEHGLAMILAGAGRNVLFDTGASGETLLANAAAMGIEVAQVDSVVISHGHYDHTGGLAAVAAACDGLKVYAHPSVWRRRWVDEPGKPLRDVSCPHSPEALAKLDAAFHPVAGPQKLEDWLVLSGPIGGPKHGREVFVVTQDSEMIVDGFEDEIFCLVRGERGWAVVTACCHRGLKNTLRSARFLARGEPLVAIFGGLHLRSAGRDELSGTVEVLQGAGSPDVYPCHCTGGQAVEFLAGKFPGKVHPVSAGKRILL
ncbi:MAG: MBL fold metallo-hydrolase [Planctomycetota bacterium]